MSIWAHGWGQDRRAFLPLATSLARSAHHTLLDFPGFGDSPRPPEDWDTADYADAVAEWLGALAARAAASGSAIPSAAASACALPRATPAASMPWSSSRGPG